MKTKIVTLMIAASAASQAQAHTGAHLHPHSVEGWVVGLGVLALVAAALIAARLRR